MPSAWRTVPIMLLVLAVPAAAAATGQTPTEPTEALARTVVNDLAEGRFTDVASRFLPPMRAALPVEKLRGAWSSVVTVAGAFKAPGAVRVEMKGPYRVAVVTAAFERNPIDIQIVFDADGKIAGFSMRPATTATYAPPSYANTAAFTESAITAGAPDWPLPGTLSMPGGDAKVAAVVLVHGSGPQDRDASFGPNRVFQDLAFGLASRGVAVLRYDKRTRTSPERLNASGPITVKEEVIDDVAAAVGLLAKHPRVDPARIVVIGHSLGGMLVPRIAGATGSAVRGFVVLAGAVRSLEQSIVEQTRYLIMADGQLTPEEQQQLQGVEQLAAIVRALTAADVASPTLISGAPAAYWFDLRGYDPPGAAAKLAQPLLVLQGERDYQVTMADFEKWRAALKGKTNATLKSYPALNHLFIAGAGPSLPAEYLTPGHVAEEVVTDIATWIAALQ